MSGFDGQVAVQVQGHAILGHQVVGEQLTLALDEHQAALLETEAEGLQDPPCLVSDLRLQRSSNVEINRQIAVSLRVQVALKRMTIPPRNVVSSRWKCYKNFQ